MEIKEILEKFETYKSNESARYKTLSDYYLGKNKILQRDKLRDTLLDNKISNGYAGYITDMATGYFIGSPVTYVAEKDFLNIVQDIYNYNDEQDENTSIAKEMSVKGRSFEIVYLDKNDTDKNGVPKLRFGKISPENMMCLYDSNINPEMELAIRSYDKYGEDGKKQEIIEIYDKKSIKIYTKTGGFVSLIEEIPHYFSIVPVIEYINNDEKTGDFEKVITSIDAYDKVQSDSINNLEYFANSYMYLVGMKQTGKQEIEEMRKLRVLLLDKAGEAGFLSKDENFENIKTVADSLKSDIHKFSMCPDMSDEQFSNNSSGIAMEYKMLGLEQLAVKKERKFKKGLQKRLEIITNYLNFRGANYDWRDMEIKFTRNLPVNDKENVEIAAMLKGLISNKSALSYLSMIDDVNAEIENIEKEKRNVSFAQLEEQDFEQ